MFGKRAPNIEGAEIFRNKTALSGCSSILKGEGQYRLYNSLV